MILLDNNIIRKSARPDLNDSTGGPERQTHFTPA